MNCSRLFRRAQAISLFSLAVFIAAPAGAAQIDVPLNNLNGNLHYKSSGDLSASGISNTGNLLFSGLDFTVPNISSTTFNSILGGSSPVLATITLNGTAGGQSGVVTFSDTFSNPASLATFFTGLADENTVLTFASGSISGAFNANLSDISINTTDREFGTTSGSGPNQLTSGAANIVATTDSFFPGVSNGQYVFTGNGTLSLEQVAAVPEPAHIGLLALALIGISLIWRRKGRGSQI